MSNAMGSHELVTADLVDAELSAGEVLAAMLGVPDEHMIRQVRAVLEYALIQEVYDGSPISADDDVLTLDFRRVFTRRDVARLLQRLRADQQVLRDDAPTARMKPVTNVMQPSRGNDGVGVACEKL